VTRIAAQRDVSMSEVALAWVRQAPDISCPIIGVSREEQLDKAVQALGLTLDAEDRSRLDALYRPRDVINDQVPHPRPRSREP
jgi:aryl-alcohol dehydrogenase-like predicted oxidoreductase